MKKGIRHIIRKELASLFEAVDGGVLDDAMGDIQAQIVANIENLENIKKTNDQDIKNKENELKGQKQLKGQLPAQNPDRQGLEREIPAKQKEIDKQKKQVKDIEKAQTDFEKAQEELQKQQLKLAQADKGEEKGSESTLKSLESPI